MIAAVAWVIGVLLAGQAAWAVPYEAAVLADNPIAYWRFNETSGINAVDATGNLHDGTYLGGYTLAQPSAFPGLGTAVLFTSSLSGRVRVPDHTAFDLGTGDYTIEAWYNTNTTSRGDIFTYKGTGGDLGVHSASQSASTISLYHNAFRAQSSAVPINTWHHLAVTRAGTAVTIYIDGIPRGSGTSSDTWNIANDLLIGSNHTGNPSNPALAFSGLLDEVAIYGTALSQVQVLTHIDAAAGRLARIGINFVGGGGPGAGQNRTLSNTDGWAGLVPQINWNNANGASGTLNALIDHLGAPTTASISWTTNATYSTGNGSSTANHILMNGYVDVHDNQTGTFIVTGIPYPLYHVYVYTDSDAADSRDESINLVTGAGDYGTVWVSDESNFTGTFTRATATSLNGPGAQGNYVLFENVIGSSFTLTGTARNFRSFINGIQVVAAVPEPTTLSLLALGGLGLLRRRCRRHGA